jgi:hypothetical protein
MAHVGHEVAADRVDATRLAAVVDEEQHERLPQRRHPGGDGEGLTAQRTSGKLELAGADLAVAAGATGQLEQGLGEQPVARDQAEAVGGSAARRTRSDPSSTTAEASRTASTRSAPGGSTGSGTGGAAACWRSLRRKASTPAAPVRAPTPAAAPTARAGSTRRW